METLIEIRRTDTPFTIIPNSVLADNTISWKAKGIISYLLGKPATWKVRTRDLENHGKGGKTEIMSALKELRVAGYARLERRTVKGRVVQFALMISSEKVYTADAGARIDVKLDDLEPDQVPTELDGPDSGNPTLENRYLSNKESSNKEVLERFKNRSNNSSTRTKVRGDARAARVAPSEQSGAAAPEPPPIADLILQEEARKLMALKKKSQEFTAQNAKAKADMFVESYKSWTELGNFPGMVTSKEKQLLIEFFQENRRTTVKELMAIAVSCMLAKSGENESSEYDSYWFCTKKGRRIETLLSHLPKIMDELDWKGSEKDMERVFLTATRRFKAEGRKIV